MKKIFITLMILLQVNIMLAQNDADVDLPFINGIAPPGAGITVNSVANQTDGKMFAGGFFTYANSTAINHLARFNSNGTTDTGFNTGSGFSHEVKVVVVQPDGKILVGGDFNSFNGSAQNYLVRLNSDGTKDTTFNIGTGFNTSVYAISLQSDGKILVGGNFTNFNGLTQSSLVRLNTNGTKDTTFSIGTGFDGMVMSLAIQPNGKIIVGGYFSSYNGVAQNSLIRLNADGTKDTTFNVGTGFTPAASVGVRAISIQNDGKIVVGGDFTIYNGVQSRRIIRLNTDGTRDNTYTIGTGFNAPVIAVLKQADGKMLVGGQFSDYNGNSPNNKIIRLNTDGTRDATFNSLGGFNGTVVNSFAINSSGNILVGGMYTTYRGNISHYITRLLGNTTLSNENFNTRLKFSLYPNPASDILNIELDSDIKNIEVYSLQGQLVMQSTLKSFSVNSLHRGVYFVKITGVDGVTSTQKFVKN